ncbi:hypothetical protein QFC22_004911 [Naganishia vaughanmartiniae]|uniref:Uncharacterized protein n=1 Tax=Naganishia vaughanmartiniae TaxID=1424756 RepID=A0ACC2WXM2_9TREE|nr:hypothetical protein QFC22_004911 [Naganishia vaughanmartiniae]
MYNFPEVRAASLSSEFDFAQSPISDGIETISLVERTSTPDGMQLSSAFIAELQSLPQTINPADLCSSGREWYDEALGDLGDCAQGRMAPDCAARIALHPTSLSALLPLGTAAPAATSTAPPADGFRTSHIGWDSRSHVGLVSKQLPLLPAGQFLPGSSRVAKESSAHLPSLSTRQATEASSIQTNGRGPTFSGRSGQEQMALRGLLRKAALPRGKKSRAKASSNNAGSAIIPYDGESPGVFAQQVWNAFDQFYPSDAERATTQKIRKLHQCILTFLTREKVDTYKARERRASSRTVKGASKQPRKKDTDATIFRRNAFKKKKRKAEYIERLLRDLHNSATAGVFTEGQNPRNILDVAKQIETDLLAAFAEPAFFSTEEMYSVDDRLSV